MPSHPNAADLPALLAMLCDAGVEFIVVGGAAVLDGVEELQAQPEALRVVLLTRGVELLGSGGM